MSDNQYWLDERLRYSDADDPFSMYCPACGGTGIDSSFDLYGVVAGEDNYPMCSICHGEGLLYYDEYS